MKFQMRLKTCFDFLCTTVVLTEFCESNFLPVLQIGLCLWLLTELNRGYQLLILTCLTEEVNPVCKDKLENVPKKRVKPHSSLRKIECVLEHESGVKQNQGQPRNIKVVFITFRK